MNNKNTSKEDKKSNPWTPEDEGDHYPSMKEWWCIQTLFKTLDDNRKWNLKSSFAYELERPSCFFLCHLFDLNSKKLVVRKSINDKLDKLSIKKNKVDLKYEKNIIKGLYPKYKIQINDEEKQIFVDMTYNAKIPPHWSVQDISNGYLPFGLDYYRYGWLLNCDLNGTLKLKGESHKIKGTGYLEKAWGNWSYTNPFQKLSGFRRAFSTYCNLFYWWLSHRKPKIFDSISFTTDNNPFGYDWFWGIFDNDWSIFYGNALFWVKKGPAFGVLTLFTEGSNYIDFCNINFHYNKCKYIKEYDLYYPVDLSLTAVLDDKKIKLRAYPTCEIYEYVEKFEGDKFYSAFTLPEIPGRIEGIYIDDEKEVKLKGDCKIEPQRQPSKLGHNSIKIDFLKPPKGVGLSVDFKLNYLKKKGFTKLQLVPHPKFSFTVGNTSKTIKQKKKTN
jgi:hypothetical protein